MYKSILYYKHSMPQCSMHGHGLFKIDNV